jgi:N-methylhydantoinase B
LHCTCPEELDPEVPANAGYYRTLKIVAPDGCVVGPVPPAAIGCRSISASVLMLQYVNHFYVIRASRSS